MVPKLAPPSSGTSPSLVLRSESPAGPPAASVRSSSFHVPLLMSHRLAPQTSLMSMGATLPRKMEARKDETSEMRAVALYASGYFSWKR